MSYPTPPLRDQIAWLLETLRTGAAGFTVDTIVERFSPTFLEAIPAEAVAGQIQRTAAALENVSYIGFTRTPTETQANVVLTTADGLAWVIPISVEQEAPHRITGLSFAPVPVPGGATLSPPVSPSGESISGVNRTDEMYDIGDGRQMYLSSVGEGGPTVILDSGLGDNAGAWFGVESAVSQFTRVCTYDRPGSIGSASTPASPPRTGMDVAKDLRALLHIAEIPGPYILVGHSIGGVFARLFAHAWPDEVAGMVLVDSSHDDQISRIRQILSLTLWEQVEPIFLPDPTLAPEGMDVPGTLDAVRAARAGGTLPEVPLVVISAGVRRDPAMLPEGWPIEEDFMLWLEMQADLATLLPGARHVIAEESGHYVHQTEPELVIDAIRQMVMALR